MQKIMVYYFNCYDIKADKTVRSKHPATRETIAACNGVVIEDTAQEVEVSRLDGNGFLASDDQKK